MEQGPAAEDGEPPPAAAAVLEPGWQPGLPSVREHVPSVIWGAVVPLAIYFLIRTHVQTDTQALIIAGSFSTLWVLFQFVRQRRVDLVGVIVLSGFAIGVFSAELLGGNAYVLKVRDAFFTAIFGAVCVITVFTHRRPAIFYVGRYLSAGQDPAKMAAYDELHDLPMGRHTFRVLSVVWGVGLVVEASTRMMLADLLPTGTFLAISPFITASSIGSLCAFTVFFSRRNQFEAFAPLLDQHTIPEGESEPQAPPS